MDDVTRRTMLWGAGASVAATGLIQEAAARTAAFGPDDPYDLVIRGGDVLDPSQNAARPARHRHSQCRIAASSRDPGRRAAAAARRRGQLVLPGLVDLHAHVLPGSGIGLPADELVPYTGTTTYVGGRCGARTTSPPSSISDRPVAHAHPGLPAHLLDRPVGLSARRDAQHRLRQRRRRRQGAGGEPRRAARHEGARHARVVGRTASSR